MKEFMEYADFAKLVGIRVSTVYRWVKSGHVKATNFGVRIHRIHCSEYNRLAGLPDDNTPVNDIK
jgi:excisionase family DNA binding protein